MYCRNCGNKVLDSDNFCANCGYNIEKNLERNENHQYYEERQNKTYDINLPMNWWNFWQYIRFPLSILFSVITIVNYLPNLDINLISISAFLIDFLFFALILVTYFYFLMQNNKYGYRIMSIYLITDSIYTSISIALENIDIVNSTLFDFAILFVIAFAIYSIVWTVPNYVYFQKRKYCFYINK